VLLVLVLVLVLRMLLMLVLLMLLRTTDVEPLAVQKWICIVLEQVVRRFWPSPKRKATFSGSGRSF
jgi:hypothetical protein